MLVLESESKYKSNMSYFFKDVQLKVLISNW